MSNQKVSSDQAKHVAKLANIPISDSESETLAQAFSETLEVVEDLKQADVSGVETTHQVTGFKNVTREDMVDPNNSFSQADALANADSENGYFSVPQVLQQSDN